MKKYLILMVFICGFIQAEEKKPHKPPILTTTATIEVFSEGKLEGIVLIERGKAPWGKAMVRP